MVRRGERTAEHMTRYRADHVGSFLRPAELLAARADQNTSNERRRQIEDQCILELLEEQQKRGFAIFSDGELRRSTFMSDFNESVDGMMDGDAVQRTGGHRARLTNLPRAHGWGGHAADAMPLSYGTIRLPRAE